MAEFPGLGKSCSLETCHRLDFTPFLCTACEKYFCTDHRFHHGCPFESVNNETLMSSSDSKPLKPYLCSMEGCFISETVRIDCEHCGFTFCLRHRYPEEHRCSVQSRMRNQVKVTVQPELEKKMKEIIATGGDLNDVAGTSTASQIQHLKKAMSEAERKRADRIAVMRLKSTTRNCNIPASEQMFLFLVRDRKRDPVMVSKHWTIGRCIDHITNQFSIPNSNATFGTKVLRLFHHADQSEPLPMSDNVEKHLKDLSSVYLKQDD